MRTLNVYIIFNIFLLLLVSCSSGGKSDQISQDLADRMTDSLEFDGGELEDTPMPEGTKTSEAPQLTKVESEEPLRIGDPFVIELETDFNEPQKIDRVLMQVAGSSKHFVIKTGVVVKENTQSITLSGILKADEELQGLHVTMLFALKTDKGILGLSRELKISVTEEDARIQNTELTTDSELWSNIDRPQALSSEDAPQILRIEAPEIITIDEVFTIAIYSRTNDAANVLVTTIGNNQCLRTTLESKAENENYTIYKFDFKIPEQNIVDQKLVLLFALQKSNDTTGLFVPNAFLLKSGSTSTDGDTDIDDSERESIITKCEEHDICCIAGIPTNEMKTCNPVETAANDLIYHSLCIEGLCKGLTIQKIVDSEFTTTLSPVNQFDISPTGEWLVSVHDDGIARVYNIKNDVEIKRFNTNAEDTGNEISPLNTVSYHPISNQFITGSANGFVNNYDVDNDRLVARTDFGSYNINSIEFSPDGTFMAISKTELETATTVPTNYFDLFRQNSSLTLWVHENTSAEFHTVGFFNETNLAFACSSSEFAIMNLNQSSKTTLAKPTDANNDTTDNNAQWSSIAISPNGKFFAAAGCIEEDSSSNLNPGACLSSKLEVRTADNAQQTNFTDIRMDNSLITALAFSPGSNQLAYAICSNLVRAASENNCTSFKIILVNIINNEEILTFEKHNAAITHLAFDPYANQLISSDKEGLIFIWDISPFADANEDFCKSNDDCDGNAFCNFKKHLCSTDQCADLTATNNNYCSFVEGSRVDLPVETEKK